MKNDDLRPMKGILIGIALSIPIWCVLAFIAVVVFA